MSTNGNGAFQHRDWESIAAERIADGIERQMIWGEQLDGVPAHGSRRTP